MNCKGGVMDLNKQLTFLDLFSGIGGFRIGLERAGFKSIGYCDNDEYANKLYKAYFNTEEELFFNDIRTINTEELPDFDILCGGHDSGKTFQTILKILTDLGYQVQWQLLNSKFFGVPQNRERVYIVGCYGKGCAGKIFPLTPDGIENISTLNKHPLSPQTPQGNRIYLPDGLSSCLTANGGGLGAKTGLYFINKPRHNQYKASDTVQTLKVAGDTPLMKVRNGTKKGFDEAGPGDGINLAFPHSKTRRGRVGKGCSQTLDTNCNMGTIDGYRIRRLTPLECFRLQGFPDEMIEKAREIGLADCRLYKMAGNAVTVNVVEAVARKIAEVENGRTQRLI